MSCHCNFFRWYALLSHHATPVPPAVLSLAEQDLVILRQTQDLSASPILTRPLDPGSTIQTHKGVLKHSDIIGKYPRDIVQSTSGSEFRIHDVSLSEYVRLTKRLVTPIYPADANLIASLFDLHVSPPTTNSPPGDGERLEILEAGTGHGALTLHLSRAIHAANPPRPVQETGTADAQPAPVEKSGEDGETDMPAPSQALASWKANRRAVIHTIDVSAKYSKHARKIVRGFRRGMYADNVEFHVGDVSAWLKEEVARRAQSSASTSAATGDGSTDTALVDVPPFLTHAFLDLPSTHDHVSTVASALRPDGMLIVFNPSVTQIADCMQKIKRERIPLYLEQTLELGTNGASGGREWDIRVVRPRSSIPKVAEVEAEPQGESQAVVEEGDITKAEAEEITRAAPAEAWSLVCRPKVGDRVIGGGFLGVFRKMKDHGR